MNADFSRTLSLLRQERGLSQRKVAKELGISQALLSHYENGIREPGLAFVVKACDYFHVSADYLLGRTLDQEGCMIDASELCDVSCERGNVLKGSIMATLHKKLLVNTTAMVFDLLGKTGDKDAVNSAAAYLGGALYHVYRLLHRFGGGNPAFFAMEKGAIARQAADMDMLRSRIAYEEALSKVEAEDFPDLSHETLSASFPGLSQSLSQVLHNAESRMEKLLDKE